jgi:hypothetical protein
MSIIDVASKFKSALQESADLYLHFLRIPPISAPPTLQTILASSSAAALITSPFPSPPPAVPLMPMPPPPPPQLPVRESGIEAAFLRMFKGWESFQEDYILALIKGEPRIDGIKIKSYIRKIRSDAPARNILLQGRPYIEWTRPRDVMNRVEIFFPNAIHITTPLVKFEPALREMHEVRNAIAHSSPHSVAQLKKLADKVSAAMKNPQRAFDYLTLEPKQNSRGYFIHLPSYAVIEIDRMTFFEIYKEILFAVAEEMLGGFPP